MSERDMARLKIRAVFTRLIALGTVLLPIVLAACAGGDGGGGGGGAPGY
jgi:hypothetical protein